MMKLKVIKAFNDKITDEFYPVGTMITVEDGRGAELIANPLDLVEVVEESKPQVKKTTKPKKA